MYTGLYRKRATLRTITRQVLNREETGLRTKQDSIHHVLRPNLRLTNSLPFTVTFPNIV